MGSTARVPEEACRWPNKITDRLNGRLAKVTVDVVQGEKGEITLGFASSSIRAANKMLTICDPAVSFQSEQEISVPF